MKDTNQPLSVGHLPDEHHSIPYYPNNVFGEILPAMIAP